MRFDIGVLFLRFCASAMMMTHGLAKLTGFGAYKGMFPSIFGMGSTVSLSLAVFAEFFCAALVMIGLCTRLASIPVIITMVVAAGVAHAGDPFVKKELPLLFAVCFSTIFLLGPGAFSLDVMLPNRRTRL